MLDVVLLSTTLQMSCFLESLISARGFTANISNPVAFYLPMADRYLSAVSSCSIFSVSEVASPSISFPLLRSCHPTYSDSVKGESS